MEETHELSPENLKVSDLNIVTMYEFGIDSSMYCQDLGRWRRGLISMYMCLCANDVVSEYLASQSVK